MCLMLHATTCEICGLTLVVTSDSSAIFGTLAIIFIDVLAMEVAPTNVKVDNTGLNRPAETNVEMTYNFSIH